MQSTREQAMDWWNTLSLEDKMYQVIPWLKSKGLDVTSRHPNSLTGREIEEIWNIDINNNPDDSLEVGMTDLDSGIL